MTWDRPFPSSARRACLFALFAPASLFSCSHVDGTLPRPAQKVDTADGEVHAVKSVQKYLREHRISGIQNQMAIVTALRAEEVLTDRIYYCLHQLVAGNRGRPAWRASPPTPQRAATRPRSSHESPTLVARRPCCGRRLTHPSHLSSPPTCMPCRHDRLDGPLWSSQRVRLYTCNQVKKERAEKRLTLG